jgi:conjugative relaxase-like TrwC/TraI family protein
MLRIIENKSASSAKTYYTLPSTADYYIDSQELQGNWRGDGAARLGLSGAVEREAWEALCDNRHPATGESLTPRRKQDRRVGYDFSFHVPKSVSLLYGLTKDERILEAFRASVDDTMRGMEREVKTRVRKDGKNEDRVSGNMVWGEFIHQTARPVNGTPDPHLHAHCFVFNFTFDDQEGRWKAAQFGDLKRDASCFEAEFHSRMSQRLSALGLPIERTRKGYEIAGFSPATLAKFSRRTARIEEKAKAAGITDPAEKSELGAKTRERKQKNLSMPELRREWTSRLLSDESDALARISDRVGSTPGKGDEEHEEVARAAVRRAVEHCFERKSVVPERQVLAEALKCSYGQSSVECVKQALAEEKLIVGERDGQRVATTAQVLAEEKAMIAFAREGRGQCPPLVKGPHVFKRDWLNTDQRRAVEHVLSSRDRVMVVRGKAGAGKTVMLKEVAEAIEAAGTKVYTFAPSADASRGVLRAEGFKNADTVALLLKDERLQQACAGQLIYIDEAGLLGTRTMAQIFDLAERIDARIVLQGDRAQHGSVERGAALRLLETEAGLVPAELKNIQRQRGSYKEAVWALSEGRTEAGFHALNKLGWIKEVPLIDRYKLLAHDYVAAAKKGKSVLVVSPTHREAENTDDAIRSELRKIKLLGVEQRRFTVLENANLTVAERRDGVNYQNGDVVVFHQNAKGHRKGERLVAGESAVPLQQAERFTAYRTSSRALSPGDLIRITANGQTMDGKRLNNGMILKVRDFTKDGDIRLSDGGTIAKDWGHWSFGYTVTSHAAQSRTTDVVLVAESAASFPAASREQFYVSVSRGRQQATIYTDDKAALLDAVKQSDERISATELDAERQHRELAAAIERRNSQVPEIALARAADRERGVAYER